MTDIQAGDKVRVFDRTGRRLDEYPGEVVKVGRTLVTIAYHGGEAQFRMDTGVVNDRWGGVWFKTEEQAARDERHAAAMDVLIEHGIRVDMGRSLTMEQAEALAEVARTFTKES